MNAPIVDARSLPVLPELADRVIRMALEDDMSMARVAGLIEKDQALTARILSLANSSYYRRSRSIYTVRDAVVVIGFDAVRTVALGVSVLGMFPAAGSENLDIRAFWRHSMACALFAQAMMEASDERCAAKAFCAGLFHDIGKLVLDRSLPEDYARVLQEASSGTRPLYEVEKEVLGATHAEWAARCSPTGTCPASTGRSYGRTMRRCAYWTTSSTRSPASCTSPTSWRT